MGEIEATSTATRASLKFHRLCVKPLEPCRVAQTPQMRCTNTLEEPAGERSGASNMSRAPSLGASMAGDLGTIQPFTRQRETVHDRGCRSIGLARGYRDGDDQHAWVEYRLWRGRALSHDAIQVVLRPKPPTRPISCAHRTCRSSRLRQGYRGCTRTHQSTGP